MQRLRRSLRESFRRKKHRTPESSKPHEWQSDEDAVRSGECSFPVKYLGCVEVPDSRGMHICEDALRSLRNSRRRGLKGILYVSGDGLRVVDQETRGLIVDQTIEKVSFCAPDRNHERGFSYICRDGTTRRWMCHGFHAVKDSGERLSHAVGCAFSICLEKKQKRDKENNVSMTFDKKTSTFTRFGSFRQSSITDRLTDPQVAKPADPPPVKQVHNPFAIQRPHATPQLLERQGSFRAFSGLGQASPFKRQLSLRLNELPSNLERHRTLSYCTNDSIPRTNGSTVAPIPEGAPYEKSPDETISEMCQEIASGLQLLSNAEVEEPFHHPIPTSSSSHITKAKMNVLHDAERTDSFVSSYPSVHSNEIKWNITAPEPPPRPLYTRPKLEQANTNLITTMTISSDVSAVSLDSRRMNGNVSIPPPPARHKMNQMRTQSEDRQDFAINTTDASAGSIPVAARAPLFKNRLPKSTSFDTGAASYRKVNGISQDPFDTEWAAVAARLESRPVSESSTNPFDGPIEPQPSVYKTSFEIQM